MKLFDAFTALVQGASLVSKHKALRKLALRPILIGLLAYLLSLYSSIKSHEYLWSLMRGSAEGFWGTTYYYLSWALATGVLLLASAIISIAVVSIFAAVYQTTLAERSLELLGVTLPVNPNSALRETTRTVFSESVKFLLLLPLLILSFLLGLIPFFAPIAFILASWLLAFQFIDIVLDLYRLGPISRLRFALAHPILLFAFGSSITLSSLVPFLGLFIPPYAVGGACWLLNKAELLQDLNKDDHGSASKPL